MKKYLKYLIVFLLFFSVFITNTDAKSYGKGLFQFDEKIIIDKELNGTSFIAGNEVEINEKINGIGFVASSTKLNINSKQDYIFGISTEINLKSDISKDLFLAAETINIDKNSTIKRDAYFFGDKVNIEGTIGRNIYIYGTTVDINGKIEGNITINAMDINIAEDANISGTLKYNEGANIEGLTDNINIKTYKEVTEITFKEYIYNFVSSYIQITLVAIVIVFICENLLKNSLKQTKDINSNKIINLCGRGFLILVGVPIIVIMLLFTGVFASVGIIGGIIYGILVYISTIFTAYLLANILDKKYFKKKMNSYLQVIIGLFIISIVSIIPIIGGFVSFVSILLGLGITGNMIIEMKAND